MLSLIAKLRDELVRTYHKDPDPELRFRADIILLLGKGRPWSDIQAILSDCNPIEWVWWHLHEEVTRNHQCQSMEELLDFTFAWLRGRNPFKVEGLVYNVAV